MAVIRVPRLWSAPSPAQAVAVKLVTGVDGLDAFGSEIDGPSAVPPPSTPVQASTPEPSSPGPSAPEPSNLGPSSEGPKGNSRRQTSPATLALAGVLVAALAGVVTWRYQQGFAAGLPAPTGSLTIQTTPAGQDVLVNGQQAGQTPLSLSLPVGAHKVEVGPADRRRAIDVAMSAGASIQHHLDMPAAAAPVAVAKSGSLHVQADVPGLSVEIDGIDRGKSPLTVPNLTPGEHQVVVRGDQRVTRRTVSIKAGETMTLVLSPPATGVAAPGWLSVTAPIVMQLRQDGKVIGTTESDRVMLPSGDHEIEVANDAIGFRESRKITVAPGKTAEIAVALPPASLSINAQPWAEVWVDGTRIGETPIANLAVAPGSHEVLFRHPQLGERRETVVVTLRQTARLGVDLRRP